MNSSCAVNPANNQTARGLKILAPFAAAFVLIFLLPIGTPRFDGALREGFGLTKWYAQEHVLLCLIPALLSAVGMELRAQPAVAAFDRHFHGYYAGTFHPAILAQGTGKTASEISPRGLAFNTRRTLVACGRITSAHSALMADWQSEMRKEYAI